MTKVKDKPMAPPKRQDQGVSSDPLWYKDAIIYQTHVRAFYDADGDGIGDFKGLTEKLDYLYDLGITAIWILPFYPSPLKDEGYDIAEYSGVHHMYGSIADFKTFLREAHERGIKVITELVLNHTSDQHAWFKRAQRAKSGSKERDFYCWSDTPEKYKDARIIFKDFEHSNWAWDPVAKSYYWHRFYSHQPDLNFDNPEVQKAVMQVLNFWLDMGVDGLRLDAVPYLFEREGTSCENLPETHEFLKKVRRAVDRRYKDKMLLAEANQWPEDAVAYFGQGDESQMAFHFPIMPRMFMAIRLEDRHPIIDILQQTPAIPDACQWAIFLRNHDELTLEMVTDEERDYMYRVYANDPRARINLGIRRRLAPLLGNNRRKIELMNGLLMSLPGTPIIYYGDEIGMGDNIYLGDRNGVRTPMQWTGDRNAGFSRSNPQKLYAPVIIDPEYHYETLNVEALQNNPHSLLWWMKRLIALRNQHKAFGRGSVEFLNPDNRKVFVFIRQHDGEKILVVANLSRFVQYVELDLGRFKDMVPVELFGKTRFPKIGDLPYFLTLSPHAFYWFSLEPAVKSEVVSVEPKEALPLLEARGSWEEIVDRRNRKPLESILPQYIKPRRWFAAKDRQMQQVRIQETISLGTEGPLSILLFLRVSYVEGEPETYLLPLTFLGTDNAQTLFEQTPQALIARIKFKGRHGTEEGYLLDAVYESRFAKTLLGYISNRRRVKGDWGELEPSVMAKMRQWMPRGSVIPEPRILKAEQSNSSILYGDKMILKLYRKLEQGRNPDVEMNQYLSEKAVFPQIPALGGYLELIKGRKTYYTLALLQELASSQGDAWKYTLDQLAIYFDRVSTQKAAPPELETLPRDPADLALVKTDEKTREHFGEFMEFMKLLGVRTAEMHMSLWVGEEEGFEPELLSRMDCRSLYQSLRNRLAGVSESLRKHGKNLDSDTAKLVTKVMSEMKSIAAVFEPLLRTTVSAQKIRVHGDYHLGQVLYTGSDFRILDFEGEPQRSLEERKMKRSPLKDVAGMIRSFHYAAYSALWGDETQGRIRPEDITLLESWAKFWYRHVSATYLKAYEDTLKDSKLLPKDPRQLKLLLDVYILDKALYEVGYELKQRPAWVRVPLQGLLELIP